MLLIDFLFFFLRIYLSERDNEKKLKSEHNENELFYLHLFCTENEIRNIYLSFNKRCFKRKREDTKCRKCN